MLSTGVDHEPARCGALLRVGCYLLGGAHMSPNYCPICQAHFWSRYAHMIAAHGWAEEGTVFPLPPTDLELEAAGQLNVLEVA